MRLDQDPDVYTPLQDIQNGCGGLILSRRSIVIMRTENCKYFRNIRFYIERERVVDTHVRYVVRAVGSWGDEERRCPM